jgi:hypothetical protein
MQAPGDSASISSDVKAIRIDFHNRHDSTILWTDWSPVVRSVQIPTIVMQIAEPIATSKAALVTWKAGCSENLKLRVDSVAVMYVLLHIAPFLAISDNTFSSEKYALHNFAQIKQREIDQQVKSRHFRRRFFDFF